MFALLPSLFITEVYNEWPWIKVHISLVTLVIGCVHVEETLIESYYGFTSHDIPEFMLVFS